MSMVLTRQQQQEMAAEWHCQNTGLIERALVASGILKACDEEARGKIPALTRRASDLGLYSKKDMTQYVGSCLMAGGDISAAPVIRHELAGKHPGENEFMQKLMLKLGPGYWTSLKAKAAPFP